MNPAQLALHAKCEIAMDNDENTNDAMLAVCLTSLVDGLEPFPERFSVCIEQERNAVTALGDQGSFLEINILSNGVLLMQRHLPPCTHNFNGQLLSKWVAWRMVETLSRAVVLLYLFPASASIGN
jgi:hypothetical protein